MRASGHVPVRRVGFRSGRDEDLAALHAVEAPVAAERGSHRMPQSVDAYVAYARNLPTQFDDHAWLVEIDGTPVAAGFCWSHANGDARQMECDVLVRRDHRRQRIGTRVLAAICEETARDGRSLLTWETFSAVPSGDAFSRHVGGRVARVNRTSALALAEVDWTMIEGWTQAPHARERGYRLETVEGVFPAALRDDAAAFHHIMHTAPRDDREVGDVLIDSAFVAELDRALVEAGRTRWTVFVRDAGGQCVGGTEVIFEPDDPRTVLQQNTGIEPAHRHLGLARWAKAEMLLRIRRDRPEAEMVRTDNANSNDAMRAINVALGFDVMRARTEWQADVADVAAHLA
jgi:GNAT superfamily N-acetyltransferase